MLFGYSSIKDLNADMERLIEEEGVDISNEMEAKDGTYMNETKLINVFAKGLSINLDIGKDYMTVNSEALTLDIDHAEYIELNTDKLGFISNMIIEIDSHKHRIDLWGLRAK